MCAQLSRSYFSYQKQSWSAHPTSLIKKTWVRNQYSFSYEIGLFEFSVSLPECDKNKFQYEKAEFLEKHTTVSRAVRMWVIWGGFLTIARMWVLVSYERVFNKKWVLLGTIYIQFVRISYIQR